MMPTVVQTPQVARYGRVRPRRMSRTYGTESTTETPPARTPHTAHAFTRAPIGVPAPCRGAPPSGRLEHRHRQRANRLARASGADHLHPAVRAAAQPRLRHIPDNDMSMVARSVASSAAWCSTSSPRPESSCAQPIAGPRLRRPRGRRRRAPRRSRGGRPNRPAYTRSGRPARPRCPAAAPSSGRSGSGPRRRPQRAPRRTRPARSCLDRTRPQRR